MNLKYTLIADGPSDANLLPIIDWTLKTSAGVALADGIYAEFWRLESPPGSLGERIVKAVEIYPCEVLFVHRDAERESPGARSREIQTVVQVAANSLGHRPAVAVIPVRMLEAWLLFDEGAIRKAAGNPNGKNPLNLPDLQRVEDRPDPKKDLKEALRAASELHGRRLDKFSTTNAFWRLVDFVDDFSPLKKLSAFVSFEKSVRKMASCNWSPGFYGC